MGFWLAGGTLLLLRSSTQGDPRSGRWSRPHGGYRPVLDPAVRLSVFVISTLIQDSDAIGGGGGGSRLDLDGGKAYLDEYRQQGDQS